MAAFVIRSTKIKIALLSVPKALSPCQPLCDVMPVTPVTVTTQLDKNLTTVGANNYCAFFSHTNSPYNFATLNC